MKNVSRFLISKRIFILFLIGLGIYFLTHYYAVSLWYILIFGVLTGVIFGKVFCRWMCPIGFMMELMMGGSKQFTAMYQYHKLGCPIAWISGWLNKWSLFKIKIDTDTCIKCGKCDKACYISSLEPKKYSLYRGDDTASSGISYSCSKCLKCVAACPNGSLKYKI